MLLAYINSKCILTLKKSIEVSKMLKSTKIQGPRKFSCSTISEKLVMDTNITVSRSFNNKHVHKISTFLPSTKTAPCKAKPDFCVQKLKMAQLHTTCKNEYWLDAKRREPSTLPDRYPGYKTVYRSPLIIAMHVACRLKLYQTALTAVLLPVSAGLLFIGGIAPASFGAVAGVSTLATVMLFLSGEIFRRTVGMIYICPEKKNVIISHLSWWGGRVDFSCEISEIIPPGQEGERMDDVYWKIRFYDSEEYFFISTRFGGILRSSDLKEIFGTF